MTTMITASLILNLVVLLPVCVGIVRNSPWATIAYGGVTPARGILLAVYVVIALFSAVLLFVSDPCLVACLLAAQVSYKLLTPITVGTIDNPVVKANLMIATFHLLTLVIIWRSNPWML
ncbi:MAG: hypothetical protein AAFO81_15275 [Pseudomonadota bacterium]